MVPRRVSVVSVSLLILLTATSASPQGAPEPPGGWPVVTVHGETWNQQQLLQRNLGGRDDQTTAFPPHRVIGNIYYVGSKSLASYLIATPQGLILINSSYERSVPVIQKSVEALGFKMSDIKILLGSHAHGDHMEGDAAVKALSGAQVVAMAEDVPALQRMTPGGKPHPIDRVIHDGDTVTLGGTTLVAHLTPGHSRGCTTWTLKVADGGRTLDVVIVGSLGVNPGFKLVNNPEAPAIADEFRRAFKTSRALECDVPLASHPAMYRMAEKHQRLAGGGPNPFIDPAGYVRELDLTEAMFEAVLAAQTKIATPNGGAPAADDLAWRRFLDWLRDAPPANGPLELLQGFQASLTAQGRAPADVGREMGVVMRLMRERNDAWPLMFDRIYKSATPNFDTLPNALLMAAIEGRTPGRALEIGMGQGRNAVGLAVKGWTVTGFDVSAEGLAVARAQAARAGVAITAIQASDDTFDAGTNQWDLIAVIYGPGSIADPGYVARLHRSLKPGGLVVVESFASDRVAAQRRPVDIDPADLRRAFSAFQILRFEDGQAVSDWDPQTTRLVRMVAQKKPD